MSENLKKFLEAVSANEELAKKVSTASKEELLAMAKELGIELTEDDLKQVSQELSDDELDAVAGGKTCVCVAGGGGEKSKNDRLCWCVLNGLGETTDKRQRCMCYIGGSGYNT